MKLSGVLGKWCLSLCSILLCLFVLVGQVAGQQASTTVNQVWVLTNANGSGGPPAWIQVMPTGGPPPTKIFGASVVYDSSNNRLILFGGNDGSFPTNDVWVFANANGLGGTPTWTQLAPSGPLPPARDNHAAVYDSANNRMVIFGGCAGSCLPALNDVWVLTNANGLGGAPSWTQLPTTGLPPAPRIGMASAYEPTSNRLILFGGQNGGGFAGSTFPEVWVLTNANGLGGTPMWTPVPFGGGPPQGQYQSSYAFDSANDRLMVAGGFMNGSGALTNAVWVLANANDAGMTPIWTNLIADILPPPPDFKLRPAVFDPQTGRMIVAGDLSDGTSNLDAWLVNNANGINGPFLWTQLLPTGGPPAGNAAWNSTGVTAYDQLNNRLIGFLVVTGVAATTTTTLISSANPSVLGQLVTFTATVNPATGSATPTGTVSFNDGAVTLGTGTLSGGQASFTAAALSVGSHSITAAYGGDSSFAGSTSPALIQVVNQTSTTTTLISSANPSVLGQLVTFTATVSPVPGSATPTGTVSFKDGAVTLGARTLSGGQASFTTAALSVGSHSITAVYGGDSSFAGSTSPALIQVVNQTSTATTLISSANPSVLGQLVTFTATVNPASGSATPTGTVTFRDGAATLGAYTLSGGQASFTTASLSVGSHSITAVYGGDSSFAGSTSPALMQAVNKASTTTTTTLISSANPSVLGQLATFSATVNPASGSATPTGTVTFRDGAATLGAYTLSGGQASFTTASLSVGSHSITAVYGGDSSFTGSTSPALMQAVNKASTLAAVSSSVNPSSLHQAVTFTASVSVAAPGAGHPSGTVTFNDGTTTLATVALNSGGMASFTTSALDLKSHSITAVYSGDGNFNGSSGSLTLNVGYFICVLFDQSKPIEREESFRIKVELCDANGVDVSSSAIKLHVTAITQISGSPGRPASPRDAGNEHDKETDFRFVRNLGTAGGYVYKLRTKDLAPGTYSLQFIVGSDPTTHTLMFRIGREDDHDREKGMDADSSKGHRDRR
jgi:Bacterial Ig-like domain (group 3)/Galactose oxidase, central domain